MTVSDDLRRIARNIRRGEPLNPRDALTIEAAATLIDNSTLHPGFVLPPGERPVDLSTIIASLEDRWSRGMPL